MSPRKRRIGPTLAVLVTSCALATIGCRPSEPGFTSDVPPVGPATPTHDDDSGSGQAVVIAVIDGDTIEVGVAGQRIRVRLLGVDSPESVHPDMPEQCFGKEATEALSRLLPPGTAITVERDVELHDHYQRLLLYVYRRSDGLFVNRWLVEEGLAEAVFYPPNTYFRSEIQQARQQAKAAGRGLWGHCDGPDQPLR